MGVWHVAIGLSLVLSLTGCMDKGAGSGSHGLIDNDQDYWSVWAGNPTRPAVLFLHAPASTLASPGVSEFTFSVYWPYYDEVLQHDAEVYANFQPRFECYDVDCPDYGQLTAIEREDGDRFSASAGLAPGSWVMHVSFHGKHGNGAFHVPIEVACPSDDACPPLRDTCELGSSDCVEAAWRAYVRANERSSSRAPDRTLSPPNNSLNPTASQEATWTAAG